MLILRLFLVVLAGIAGHQTYRPSQAFGMRWGSLLRYAIGMLLFIPAQIIVMTGLPKDNERFGEVERNLAAGLLAAGALGTGTLIGHFIEPVEK